MAKSTEPKQVPQPDYLETALQWAFNTRHNLDPFVDTDSDGNTVYCMRLRPWSNTPRDSIMFFAFGDTAYDALSALFACYRAKKSVTCDFGYRPWGTRRLASNGADTPF